MNSMYLLGGGLLFGLSDTILAISNFVQPLYMSGYAIMVTYYLAQFGIAVSTVSTEPKRVPLSSKKQQQPQKPQTYASKKAHSKHHKH